MMNDMHVLLENTKVRFNFELLDRFEAGIRLAGHEVKTLRTKRGSLDGAYITVRGGEAFLMNAYIPPYQEKNTPEGYDPNQRRTLLLSRDEINQLAAKEAQDGLTIVPILVYSKGPKIKVELAVARGKKKFDKRQTVMKRESDRDIQRTLKRE
jgi:SsrA-binding protein